MATTKKGPGRPKKPKGEKKVQQHYQVKSKYANKAAKAIEFLISERFND